MILQTRMMTDFAVDIPAQLIADSLVSRLTLQTPRVYLLICLQSGSHCGVSLMKGQSHYCFSVEFHFCGFLHSEFLHPLLVIQDLQCALPPSGVFFFLSISFRHSSPITNHHFRRGCLSSMYIVSKICKTEM